MTNAIQLPLSLSVADSVTLQDEHDRAVAYARETSRELHALRAENDRLQDDLKATQAQARSLEGTLRLTQIIVQSQEMQISLLTRAQAPSPTLDTDTLMQLVKLCHPDRWQGQPAEQLAHEVTVVLNQLRQAKGVRP